MIDFLRDPAFTSMVIIAICAAIAFAVVRRSERTEREAREAARQRLQRSLPRTSERPPDSEDTVRDLNNSTAEITRRTGDPRVS
jgi:hypothetical protein